LLLFPDDLEIAAETDKIAFNPIESGLYKPRIDRCKFEPRTPR
jgi:hypothetical protein